MSLEHYTALTEDVEAKLDEADYIAETTTERYTADEVFDRVMKRIDSHEKI